MSDGEILQRFEALHAELKAGFIDIRGDLLVLTKQVRQTNGRVKDQELWRAKAQGFGIALALFLAVMGGEDVWAALRGVMQ